MIPFWTLEDVRMFDPGAMSPYAPYGHWDPHGKTQKQVPGTRITTLKEVLQLVQDWGNDIVFSSLETKVTPNPLSPASVQPADWIAKFHDLVTDYDMQHRVMLQFSPGARWWR